MLLKRQAIFNFDINLQSYKLNKSQIKKKLSCKNYYQFLYIASRLFSQNWMVTQRCNKILANSISHKKARECGQSWAMLVSLNKCIIVGQRLNAFVAGYLLSNFAGFRENRRKQRFRWKKKHTASFAEQYSETWTFKKFERYAFQVKWLQ